MNKDLLIIVSGRLSVAIVNLLSLRIMTALLSPKGYGELSLLISIQAFCGLLLVSPIGQYINVNTHRWYDEGTLFDRIHAYRRYLVLVAGIGGLAVLALLYDTSSNVSFAVLSLFLMVWGFSWNSTLVPLLNMLGGRKSAVLWSVITVSSGMILSSIFAMFNPTANSWLFGQALGMALGTYGATHSLKRFKVKKITKACLIRAKEIWSYCLPLALATGLMWLSQSGYRFVVEYYWGLSALAFLAVGLQVSSAVWGVLETIVMQFLYPYFFRAVTEEVNQAAIEQSYSDLLNVLIPIYILLAAFFIVAAPYILVLLLDEKYHSALNFLILGALADFFRVVTNIFSNSAHVKRKTRYLILPYFLGSIMIVIGIIFIGVLDYPIIYAGFTLVIASIFIMFTMAFVMNILIPHHLEKNRLLIVSLLSVIIVVCGSFMPQKLGFLDSFLALSFLSLLATSFLVCLLIRNKALKRLTSAQLTKEDPTL